MGTPTAQATPSQERVVTAGRRLTAVCLLGLMVLLLSVQPASADSIQVTFTGSIYFTFDQQFGGPSFHGIGVGNAFSAMLTYDAVQPNLADYIFTVTVQTSAGPVTLGGPSGGSNPIQADHNVADEFGTIDTVNNSGSSVAFVFRDYTHTALSSGFAGLDWQNLLTLSSQPQLAVRAPNGAVVAEGSVHDMFLRAPNAAVVVIGRIDGVSVQTIPWPPVPEPSTLLLLGIGLAGVIAVRRSLAPG